MNLLFSFLMVAAGGGAGAVSRGFVTQLARTYLGSRFPWGTLIINITGSFLLGIFYRWVLPDPLSHLLAVGLLGGYTTFSTFNYESIALLKDKAYVRFVLYVLGTYVICIGAAALGYLV